MDRRHLVLMNVLTDTDILLFLFLRTNAPILSGFGIKRLRSYLLLPPQALMDSNLPRLQLELYKEIKKVRAPPNSFG